MSLHHQLLVLLLQCSMKRVTAEPSFRQSISCICRRRRDRRVTRQTLREPEMSPFAFLFSSGAEQSRITLTGFDYRKINYLLQNVSILYRKYTPYSEDGYVKLLPLRVNRRGSPRSMSATKVLGPVLAWGRTKGPTMVLCILFGITCSVCSLFLRFGRRRALCALSLEYYASIRLQSIEEVGEFKDAIGGKDTALEDVCCVADGLKLQLQQYGYFVIQNMFYKGWTHDHYVSNILVFAPSGVVIICALNAPGAVQDSVIAEWGSVYKKLQDIYERTGTRCVVDSAFSKCDHSFLMKSSQDPLERSIGNFGEIVKLKEGRAMGKAAEWRMRAFQGSFTRMKDRFV